MRRIVIKLKTGERREFLHEGRAGGSYTKTIRYENGWVIVTDEWSKETAFPESTVESVEAEPERSW